MTSANQLTSQNILPNLPFVGTDGSGNGLVKGPTLTGTNAAGLTITTSIGPLRLDAYPHEVEVAAHELRLIGNAGEARIFGEDDDGNEIPVQIAGLVANEPNTISTDTTLIIWDAGCTTRIAAQTATTTTLPDLQGTYKFVLIGTPNGSVQAITVGAANMDGFVIQNGAVTQVIGAHTLSFSATANVGDQIELTHIATNLWAVKAFSSAAAGITVS